MKFIDETFNSHYIHNECFEKENVEVVVKGILQTGFLVILSEEEYTQPLTKTYFMNYLYEGADCFEVKNGKVYHV